MTTRGRRLLSLRVPAGLRWFMVGVAACFHPIACASPEPYNSGLAPGASTVASGLTLCELKLLSPHGLMRPALFPTLFADRTWRREHFESLRYAVSTRRTTARPRWNRARVARDP